LKLRVIVVACSIVALAACNNANDAAEDKIEREAKASASAAGPAQAALGLTEAQLLNADLVDPAGAELGDIAQILRDGTGKVDRLLIVVEDSNPDRFVHVPIAGLKTVVRGADTDLSSAMTREQLAALPEVKLPTP
jgi:hypothetical protein